MTSPDGISWTMQISRRLIEQSASEFYFIRFTGLAKHDETWEFCGVSGIIGEGLNSLMDTKLASHMPYALLFLRLLELNSAIQHLGSNMELLKMHFC